MNWQWWREEANTRGLLAILAVVSTLAGGGWALLTYLDRGSVGYTIEQHEKALARREAELRMDLERAHAAEQDLLRRELAEVERQKANLDTSFKERGEELRRLRLKLADVGEGIAEERIKAAQEALDEGNTTLADEIFAEVERMEQQSVERAAEAAFQRGKIAEDEIRWSDATKHYAKAARLVPNYDRLNKVLEFSWRVGRYYQAARWAEDFLEFVTRKYGRNSKQTATALTNLGTIYHSMGRYAEAEPLLRQAIKIDENTLVDTGPDSAAPFTNLGALLWTMERYEEAEPLLRKALAISEKTLGNTNPDYAIDVNNLAKLLHAMHRYAEAERLYRKAIEIDKATLGNAHPQYANHLGNLASLLDERESFDEARRLFDQALSIERKVLGDMHSHTKQTASDYARFLREHFPGDPALTDLEANFGADIDR